MHTPLEHPLEHLPAGTPVPAAPPMPLAPSEPAWVTRARAGYDTLYRMPCGNGDDTLYDDASRTPYTPQGGIESEAGGFAKQGPSGACTVPDPQPTQTVGTQRVLVPLALTSPNAHELPMARHRRVASERGIVAWALVAARMPHAPMPCTVTLIRKARRRFDDDNVIAAFKATRDEVARHFAFDDRNPMVKWVYGQGYASKPVVEITVAWSA